ncbi:NPP1 family protein [Uliginosibacterium gangwonense]|uniref:NPP1 family protein n=1 Tax=Uliginosibacterium gangwonense TaxID=392736 RepID=UPI000476E1E1|nr:NPP1 family protein [Uliginosibacterium gangwonense]
MTKRILMGAGLACALVVQAQADFFGKLDQALPSKVSITANYPVFDFDTDGCLPSAGISREGKQNGGLAPSGALGGGCRAAAFLDSSNTLHRYACILSAGDTYCGHFYALYFLKDQISVLGGGHRHDWEYAAIWTKNGVVTHGGYSAHGKLYNAVVGDLPMQAGHMKIVYHKDGLLTHSMRFAGGNEMAENAYGQFVTPPIISWYELKGDGVSNVQMRKYLNSYDYGSATIPMRDDNFLNNLNTYKPASYPSFTQASIEASQP